MSLRLNTLCRGLTVLAATTLLAACYANNAPTTAQAGVSTSAKQTAPAVSIAVSPDALVEGQDAILTWDASGATACNASGAWSNAVAMVNHTGLSVGPFDTPGTYSFNLTCTGTGGSTSASQVITVGKVDAPTIQLDIVPAEIAPGASATITWSTVNATSCTGSAGAAGWEGNQPTANLAGLDTGAIPTAGAYAYVLTCLGPGGSTQTTSTLTVTPTAPAAVPTVFFAAQPTQVVPGQASTLSWTTTGASACTASGGTGSNWSGSQPSSSTGTSTGALATQGSFAFTLTCTGPGGSIAKTATVVVTPSTQLPAVTAIINVSPSEVASGGTAYLSWSTSNANACIASGSWSGVEPILGSMVSTGTLTTPGTHSYTLTCTGPGGSTSGTATLTVSAPPATVTSLSASPTTVTIGQSIALSWASDNATSCSASGGTGTDGWAGAQATTASSQSVGPINQTGTIVYTLDCTGPGGTGTPQSITVVANSATPAPAGITVFAATPSSIQVGQSATLNWVTVDATSCTASGGSGNWGGPVGTQSVATSTGALSAAGVYTYTLTCTGPGGSNSSSVVVNVENAPSGPAVITSFTATPPTIQTGQAASLAWTTSGASSCSASGAWSGTQATASSGTTTGTLPAAGTYTYSLTCTGPGGTGTARSVTVTVTDTPSAASVTTFTAAPSVIQVGQSVTLSWTSQNATGCTASGAWSGSENTSSTGTNFGPINVAGTDTFSLACTGAGGSAGVASVTVLVMPVATAPPSIVAFTVAPTTIEEGQSAVLSWVTLGANNCTASGGTGAWSGSVGTSSLATSTGSISTAGSYVYTLTCTGAGGTSTPSSAVLNVTSAPPPVASITLFTATPNTILTGQSVLLAWTSTSATSCAATGGAGSDGWNGSTLTATGSQLLGPLNTAGTYVYTLTCTGPGGTSTASSVTVDVDSTPPPPTILSFTMTPTTLQVGATAVASWSTTGATSCTATGGTPSDGWTGTLAAQSTGTVIGPIATVGVGTYVLTCSGPGGTSSSAIVTLLITQTAPAAAVNNFAATPTAIQVGQSAQLSWTSSNATECTATGGTNAWGGTVSTSSTGTSSGAIATAGIYTFYLTCSGTGGTSLTAAAAVTVTAAPPPVTISAFAATPALLQIGQSTSLSWSSNGATACTASGGTGSDGWGGTGGATGSKSVGPFNSAGVYIYTLICVGPGGVSAPTSLTVTATPVTPAASIASFTATPTVVQAGQSISLAWSTSNATSCTAGGGTGSDGWTGSVGTSSNGLSVGPLSAGTIAYTLTCQGPGGSSAPSGLNVTVNAIVPPPPTVTLVANGSNPVQVAPGATLTLSWTSSNASTCTASGGAGGWSGSEPSSSSGTTVTTVTTPGIYSYTLTCAGAGGSSASTVQVTVIPSQSYDCGIPSLPTSAMVSPAASVTTSKGGLCLLDCTVSNASNVIDSNPNNYATMELPLAVAGTESLAVTDTATFPGGRTAGFIVANGDSLLDVSLIQGLAVQTLLNGVVQETATTGSLSTLLQVQAAGLLSIDPYAGYAEFTATKPFNELQLVAGSLITLNSNLRVYSACVSQQ